MWRPTSDILVAGAEANVTKQEAVRLLAREILRHSDPRITTETYGHLQPDYLRSEIDRLHIDAVLVE